MHSWNRNIDEVEDAILQVVTFKIDKEDFGFDIQRIKEIIRVPDITIVPKSPYYIKGIINLRGNVIPIIDLRKRFKLEPVKDERRIRIVIAEFERSLVGFLVDMVWGIKKIEKTLIQPPLNIISGVDSECINGIAKMEDGIIILLDIDKILYEETEGV